jgi:hypothetical protein
VRWKIQNGWRRDHEERRGEEKGISMGCMGERLVGGRREEG